MPLVRSAQGRNLRLGVPQLMLNAMITAVFSKSYCPYCKASKQLLTEMGARAYIVELDQVGMFHIIPSRPVRRGYLAEADTTPT